MAARTVPHKVHTNTPVAKLPAVSGLGCEAPKNPARWRPAHGVKADWRGFRFVIRRGGCNRLVDHLLRAAGGHQAGHLLQGVAELAFLVGLAEQVVDLCTGLLGGRYSDTGVGSPF